jgi:hypothetical protein
MHAPPRVGKRFFVRAEAQWRKGTPRPSMTVIEAAEAGGETAKLAPLNSSYRIKEAREK